LVDLVLFDIGGVLVRYDPQPLFDLLPGAGQADWADFMLADPIANGFESGRVSEAAFFGAMAARFGPQASVEALRAGFDAWVIGLFPGAEALVKETAARVRTGCLSNGNPVHWPRLCRDHGMDRWFEPLRVSFLVGLAKPDPAAFLAAAEGVEPGRVLLLDDHPHNIAVARSLGWQAERVVGADAARAALVGRGLLQVTPASW